MKTKQFAILSLFLLVFGATSLKAQSIDLLLNNRIPVSYQLASLKSLTFNTKSMILHQSDGNVVSLDLSAIQSIFFNDVVMGSQTTELSDGAISLHPNPAKNKINIKNLPEIQSLAVFYRSDGTMIRKISLSKYDCLVDIETFPAGLIFIRIDNQVLKFIKL